MAILCVFCDKVLKSETQDCSHEEVDTHVKAHKVLITRGKKKGDYRLVIDSADLDEYRVI